MLHSMYFQSVLSFTFKVAALEIKQGTNNLLSLSTVVLFQQLPYKTTGKTWMYMYRDNWICLLFLQTLVVLPTENYQINPCNWKLNEPKHFDHVTNHTDTSVHIKADREPLYIAETI